MKGRASNLRANERENYATVEIYVHIGWICTVAYYKFSRRYAQNFMRVSIKNGGEV